MGLSNFRTVASVGKSLLIDTVRRIGERSERAGRRTQSL